MDGYAGTAQPSQSHCFGLGYLKCTCSFFKKNPAPWLAWSKMQTSNCSNGKENLVPEAPANAPPPAFSNLPGFACGALEAAAAAPAALGGAGAAAAAPGPALPPESARLRTHAYWQGALALALLGPSPASSRRPRMLCRAALALLTDPSASTTILGEALKNPPSTRWRRRHQSLGTKGPGRQRRCSCCRSQAGMSRSPGSRQQRAASLRRRRRRCRSSSALAPRSRRRRRRRLLHCAFAPAGRKPRALPFLPRSRRRCN